MNNFDPREHVGLLIKFLNGKITNKVNKNLVEFNLIPRSARCEACADATSR